MGTDAGTLVYSRKEFLTTMVGARCSTLLIWSILEHKFKQGTKMEWSGKIPKESMKIRARKKLKIVPVQIAPSGMDFARTV